MNKKFLGVASLVLAIISLVPFIVVPDTLSGAKTFIIVAIALAVLAIVLGFVGKKESKGLSIAGIIIGFISAILMSFSLIGYVGIEKASDCVDNGDGTSNCKYMGEDLEGVPNIYLREDQMAE